MLFAKMFQRVLESADDMPESGTASSMPFPPSPKFVEIKKKGKKSKIVLKQPGPTEIRAFPKMD
jgi:hypothetical protein